MKLKFTAMRAIRPQLMLLLLLFAVPYGAFSQPPQRIDPHDIFTKQELEKILPKKRGGDPPPPAPTASEQQTTPASEQQATPAPETAPPPAPAPRPALETALDPPVDALTAEKIEATLHLPQLLQITPQGTYFLLLINDFEKFRRSYEERVVVKLRDDPALRSWRRYGLPVALAMAYEQIHIDWPTCFYLMKEEILIGLARVDGENQTFAMLTNTSRSYDYADKMRLCFFEGPKLGGLAGSMLTGTSLGYLTGCSAPVLLGQLQTLIEFPRTYPPGHLDPAVFAHAGDPDNIYFLWYDNPSTAPARLISGVTGRAHWTSQGMLHDFDIRDEGGQGLAAMFAPQRPFQSFGLVPDNALLTVAANFRDAAALYDALMNTTHPLAFLAAPARKWLLHFGKQSGLDPQSVLFQQLGQEWNFAIVPVSADEVSPLLLIETKNDKAAQFALNKISNPSQSSRGTYLNASYIQVQYRDRKWFIGTCGGFMFVTDRIEAMKAAVESKETGVSFARSAQLRAAEALLKAEGAVYGYYHAAACLAQMGRTLEKLPLDQPGFFGSALPLGPADDGTQPGPPPTLKQLLTNMDSIGCLRLQIDGATLHAEIQSATGFGPYEFAVAALIERQLYGRLKDRLELTRAKLVRLNQKIAEYAAANQHPPRFRHNTDKPPEFYEMYPAGQLNLPSGLDMVDPFASFGEALVYFATDTSWLLLSRGPDYDLDLTPQNQFDPAKPNPVEAGIDNLYDPTNGSISNGDLVIHRRQ